MTSHFSVFTVKFVPAWFPGAGWKRLSLRVRSRLERLAAEPYHNIKQEVVSCSMDLYRLGCTSQLWFRFQEWGRDPERSFAQEMIQKPLADDEIQKWVASTVCRCQIIMRLA